MDALFLTLALLVGAVLPMQATINNHLRLHIESGAVLAAFVSFFVGTVALAIAAVASGERWQSVAALSTAKPWQFAGGLIGAILVFGTTFLAPRIGVAKMISLIVAGQVLSSLIIDQQGWMGLAVREVTLPRAMGAALVVVGVLLVNADARW